MAGLLGYSSRCRFHPCNCSPPRTLFASSHGHLGCRSRGDPVRRASPAPSTGGRDGRVTLSAAGSHGPSPPPTEPPSGRDADRRALLAGRRAVGDRPRGGRAVPRNGQAHRRDRQMTHPLTPRERAAVRPPFHIPSEPACGTGRPAAARLPRGAANVASLPRGGRKPTAPRITGPPREHCGNLVMVLFPDSRPRGGGPSPRHQTPQPGAGHPVHRPTRNRACPAGHPVRRGARAGREGPSDRPAGLPKAIRATLSVSAGKRGQGPAVRPQEPIRQHRQPTPSRTRLRRGASESMGEVFNKSS